MLGHPALLLLTRLKLKALIRQQSRRLKRPSGWIFAGLGLISVLVWMSVFFFGELSRASHDQNSEAILLGTQFGIFVVSVLSFVGAFSHRGLYLPKGEIELCFSAPLSRGELVRYRLVVNLLRSVVAGILFGVGAARRMPVGLFGFTGVFVTMMTLPILGQAAALLLGDAENRLGKLARHLPLRYFSAVLGAVVGLGVAWLFFDGGGLFEAAQSREAIARFMNGLTDSPVVRAVLWPCKPWALLITAADFETFAIWLVFCVAMWIVAFELTARIAVDFRELSLETSADVAKRLNRVRRGGVGASGASVSKQALGWRVPWVFGTRAFGAIAWLKLASMVRKARGTLVVSVVIMSFVTLLFTAFIPGDNVGEILGGAAAIAVLGTLYMCAGLRFDFRADLEHMESIKSWPVGAVAAFVATLLPEVVLVSAMLGVAILSRAAFTAAFHPGLLGIMALQPLVTLAWVALDNAVFLYSPVRYSPGQEGALQHMGRSIVLMLLRIGLLFVSLLCAGIPAGLAFALLTQVLDVDLEPALWIAGTVAWCGLFIVDLALVFGGGHMLRRFDVARDRA